MRMHDAGNRWLGEHRLKDTAPAGCCVGATLGAVREVIRAQIGQAGNKPSPQARFSARTRRGWIRSRAVIWNRIQGSSRGDRHVFPLSPVFEIRQITDVRPGSPLASVCSGWVLELDEEGGHMMAGQCGADRVEFTEVVDRTDLDPVPDGPVGDPRGSDLCHDPP